MSNPYRGKDKQGMKQARKAEKLSKGGSNGMNLESWANYAKSNSKVGKGGDGGGFVKPAKESYPLSAKSGGSGSGKGRLTYTHKV